MWTRVPVPPAPGPQASSSDTEKEGLPSLPNPVCARDHPCLCISGLRRPSRVLPFQMPDVFRTRLPCPKPAGSERPQPSHGCAALRDAAEPGCVNRPHTVGHPASPASCSCCRCCGEPSCATASTCTSEDARPESRAEFVVPARKVPADRTEKKQRK